MNKLDSLFPINFSHSSMQDVWKCELSWFRKHCQRLTRGDLSNSNLLAGGAFAKGCELVRKSFYNDKKSIDEAIDIGYNSIIESPDTGDYIKSNERVALSLRKYFHRFPLDDTLTPVKLANGEHAIEYNFEFDLGIHHPELPDTNLVYKGKLDGLYERTHHGKRVHVYVVDEKTTGNVYRLFGTKLIDIVKEEDQYKTEGQFIGYHWAARNLGIKTHSSLVYKIPIMKEYEPAYCLDIPITEFQIDIWSATLINKIEELKDKYLYYRDRDELPHYSFYAPLTNSACNSWGRNCSFSAGCKSKDGEALIAGSFQQMVWLSKEQRQITLKEFKQTQGIK